MFANAFIGDQQTWMAGSVDFEVDAAGVYEFSFNVNKKSHAGWAWLHVNLSLVRFEVNSRLRRS